MTRKGVIHGSVGSATARAAAKAEASVRRNLSGHLLSAARHNALLLANHDAMNRDRDFGAHWLPAFWMAAAAFLLAHAAAEATLNEAADDKGIDDQIMKRFSKGPVLERTNKIFDAIGLPTFPRNSEPWKSMNLLTQIRDNLVHFKPEWSHKKHKHYQLSELLIKEKLPLAPNLADPVHAFPLGCMTAGCAEWAVSTAHTFIREICRQMGTTPRA